MYKIKTNGVERYSDTLVYAKLAENDCYVPCDMDDAEYVVGKVPTEDGVADTVFQADATEIECIDGSLALVKIKADVDSLLALIGDAVEQKYNTAMEVISNV